MTAVLAWVVEHPVVFASVALPSLLMALVRYLRFRHPATDPRRAFTTAQRTEAFSRASGRCEYPTVLLLRCRRPAEHADHLHPWSRGGATTLLNCVAACERCNLKKSAKVLPRWRVRLVERRRKGYFPPGAPVDAGERYRDGLTW